MAVTFNSPLGNTFEPLDITKSLFSSAKNITRDALEGIGLDTKYMQEPLGDGITLEPVNIQESTPQGITLEPVINTAPEGAELIPDYVNGIAESLVKRKEQLKGTIESYESGESNILTANLATASAMVGTGVDVLAETGILALKGLSVIVPDAIEDPIIDTMKKGFKFLFETEEGQAALEALKKGAGHWAKFEHDNPEYAKIVGGVVNTALLFAPLKTKAKISPKNTTVGAMAIAPIEKAAGKQLENTVKKRVERLLAPAKTEDRIVDITNVSVRGKNLGDKRGFLGLQKIQQNEFELFRNKLVEMIPGVKGKDLIVNTANVVRKYNKKKAEKLMDDLERLDISWNFPEGTQSEILKMVTKTLENKSYLQADASMAKMVEMNLNIAMKEIAKFPNTPAGLLKARQSFDKILRDQAKGAAFDPKVINATTDSANAVRTAINDLVQSRVASSNVAVKQSLREQHALWNAQNILDMKAVKEGDHAFSRIWQNINPLVDTQLAINRTIAVAGGMTAFQGAQLLALPIAGGAVAFGIGYAFTKGTLSISGKRALASTLSLIDRSLRLTNNKHMIRQLRIDRAYIADLMKQPLTKEDESFAVN